jgi:mannose-6-phosphate isomerase class I
VLTQDGWDSAHAVANMRLDTPAVIPPQRISDGVERIVQFDEFGVWQARLTATLNLPAELPYALAFCISGQATLTGPGDSLALNSGEAAFIPRSAIGRDIQGDSDCLLLLAAPGL